VKPKGLAARVGLAALAALADFSCKQATDMAPDPVPVAEPALPPPASVPLDHLAPDELVEGDRTVFQLRLPRDLKVDGTFTDVAFASGPLAIHPLVKYFRARLADGSLREGDEAATFEHVHVPGKSTDDLTVRITKTLGRARVEIRNVTPVAQPNLPDDAARWRRAGLTPQGRVLDPTRFE
jgi:hypothetical protein